MTALQAKKWSLTVAVVVCLTLNAVQGLTIHHEKSENKGYTRMHMMRRSYSNSNRHGGSTPERVERDNINAERFPPYFDTNEGAGIRDDEVYVVAPDRFHKRYYLKHDDDYKRDSFDQFGAVTSPREHSVKEGSKYSTSSRPKEYHAKESSSYSELTQPIRELSLKDIGSFAGAHPREYHAKEESNFGSVTKPREYTSKEKSNFGALYSSGVSGSSGESSSHEEATYGGHTNKKENGNFGGYFNSREGVSWSSAKDGGRGGSGSGNYGNSGSGGYDGSGSGGYGGSGSGNYGDSGSSASGGYGGSGSPGSSGSGYNKGASSNYGGSHGKASGYSSGSSGYSGSGYSSSSPSAGSHKGSTSYISGLGGNFGGGVNSHGKKTEVKGLLQAKYIAPNIKKEKTETYGYLGSEHEDVHEDEHHGNDGYEFEYFVHDPHTHDMKTQKEHSDGHTVKGQYTIVQPDGLLRTVDYTADWKNGFQAKVHYSPAPKIDDHDEHAYSATNFNLYNKGHH